MVMERENHENLLQELLNPELEQTRRTEILQELRTDYDSVISDHTDMTNRNTELQRRHDDLVVSNSQLFRQVGDQGQNQQQQKENEEKEYSETVTIEELENQVG